jgi:MFS transporter, FSR family, fosmidomycin resistance protein
MSNRDVISAINQWPRSEFASATPLSNSFSILAIYGTAHLVVDACCAALVFRIVSADSIFHDSFLALLLLYHVLAFGLQAPLGLAIDAIGMPRLAAVLGGFISATALLFSSAPLPAIILAGLGNAIFHIGAGVICLRITPHRASAAGIFVAPGSLGLLIGVVLGKQGASASVALFPFALMLCFLMACISVPGAESTSKTKKLATRGELIIGLILIAISIRSLMGFLASFPWETHPISLIMLTMATVLGKALGGIIADRWGWIRVGTCSFVTALPFLALVSQYPLAAIPGLFLLNLTMPITLAAIVEALPGHPGFAFGLTCLAVLAGAVPSLLGISFASPVFVTVMILFSALVLYNGLRLLPFNNPFQKIIQV